MISDPMDDERREQTEERDPLTRIAEALEKLASDPEVEIEAGPPICPSCGKFDPVVILPADDGGRGLLSNVIVNCQCTECGNAIYVAIESYSVHKTFETLKVEMESRKAGGASGTDI